MSDRLRWPKPARDVFDDLRVKVAGALADQLVGLYVFGSLVTGDFDLAVSDIDVLAVLNTDLTDSMFAQLDAVHAQVLARHPGWTDRLEVIYFSPDAITLEAFGRQIRET